LIEITNYLRSTNDIHEIPSATPVHRCQTSQILWELKIFAAIRFVDSNGTYQNSMFLWRRENWKPINILGREINSKDLSNYWKPNTSKKIWGFLYLDKGWEILTNLNRSWQSWLDNLSSLNKNLDAAKSRLKSLNFKNTTKREKNL